MRMNAWLALPLALGMGSAQALSLINESFEGSWADLIGSQGWAVLNKSDSFNPAGTWVRGIGGALFDAQLGDRYATATFNSTLATDPTSTAKIENWLFTPSFSMAVAGHISFWVRTADAGYVDKLDVLLSSSGASLDTSSFTKIVQQINPQGSVDGVPQLWTQYTADFSAAGDGSTGRLAFVYKGDGASSNLVALDNVQVFNDVSAVPEPSTYGLMALGLAVVGFAARRRKA